jgi:hypothetical protein
MWGRARVDQEHTRHVRPPRRLPDVPLAEPGPGAPPPSERTRPHIDAYARGVGELRIGTRERELAMGALDEHMREGRLDPTEYAERSAVASNARFRSELDALFTDLPDPHPAFPTASPSPHTVADGQAATPSSSSASPTTEARTEADLPELVAPLGARLGRNAGKLSALVPIVVLALFVLTGLRFPQLFLLVPASIALLGWLGHRHGG